MSENIAKRKHKTLTVLQKVDIIKRLESGTSVRHLASLFGISTRTIYDISKNKQKILQFYASSDSNAGIANRKSMRPAKDVNLDAVVYEWFRQRRDEGVPITGPLLCEKAKMLHEELKIEEPCNFSSGWLTRFKQRHGIRYLKSCGEKLSADSQAAEEFIEEFSKLVQKENLSPEQVYNMDETGLFWRYFPRNTLATSDETAPTGVKDAKERVTVAVCSNAAGTHKCKLMVISKSAHPRALKGSKNLPVIYQSNKSAWNTRELTLEWFQKNFIPEVRAHGEKIGLSNDCKIVLLVDNCRAHPEIVTQNNVSVHFLPPNTTSLIQPMDQGIIRSMKCHYRFEFMRKMLSYNFDPTATDKMDEFRKNFTIKDCIFLIAKAWDTVSHQTLISGWKKLWPATLFLDVQNDDSEFTGFRSNLAREKAAELLKFAKESSVSLLNSTSEDDLVAWMDSQDEILESQKVTDAEIISSVLNSEETDSDTESDIEEEKIVFDEVLSLGDKYLSYLEKPTLRNFVTDQEILTVRRLQNKIAEQKKQSLKQTTITSMFDKLKNK